MQCPSLGDEGTARLEARARAQLAPGDGDVEVRVRCEGAAATLEVHDASGSRASSLSIAPSDSDPIDAILAALRALLAPAPNPLPASAPPAPTTPTTEPPPEPAEDVVEPAPSGRAFAVVFGADAELWQGAVGGAAGAHLGATFDLGPAWAVTVFVAPAWGLGEAAGTTAWTLRGVAQIDWLPIRALRASLGATGRVLWAQATTLTPSQQEGTTGGAEASLRISLPVGPFELSAGPTLDVLARPIVIDVGGSELFRLPVVVGAVTIEGRYPGR